MKQLVKKQKPKQQPTVRSKKLAESDADAFRMLNYQIQAAAAEEEIRLLLEQYPDAEI